MPVYVECAINLPTISGMYHYHLPVELEGRVLPGSLLMVPFGKQTVQAIAWRFVGTPEVAQTRAVLAVLDAQPVLTAAQLALAEWLARETLAPLAACFDLMLPPGMSKEADRLYTLKPEALPGDELSNSQERLVAMLRERGALRGKQVDRVLHFKWREMARKMEDRGWLLSEPVLPLPSVHARTGRKVSLAVPAEQINASIPALGRAGSEAARRRLAILEFLAGEQEPVDPAWAIAAAGGGSSDDMRKLAELGLVTLVDAETFRDPLEKLGFVLADAPKLTEAQADVWRPVCAALRAAAQGQAQKPHILYGITSSGKTEIYLSAVAEALRLGRQVVILVPEIALTPQTARRFAARFPGQVGLVHSRLSEGERYDTWRRARAGKLSVIVGPRSALFTPLPNLGLIVVDEFHDDSYYQDDTPAYHAVGAAMALARLSGALVLMGSATPDVTLMERARLEGWPVLRLPLRILAHRQAVQEQMARLGLPPRSLRAEGEGAALELPKVEVVDMRQELKAGNRTIFSRALRAALQDVLDNHQQAILFLNRRGTSTYVFCRDCGASLDCPRCDIPLTYHTVQNAEVLSAALQGTDVARLQGGQARTLSAPLSAALQGADAARLQGGEAPAGLICHTCGYRRKLPEKCPKCASRQIRQFGLGTEKVESEVLAQFPGARALRWDAETAKQKDAHDLLLSHFTAHRADILVGTQMIAKGLDLPLVTLVGVILADVGLQLPDFRAGERGFQLLTQVAGRAGRSPLGGRAIFQTYRPEHYAIQAAAAQDYEAFLRQELAFRRKLGYPPYSRLARLELRDKDEANAAKEAARMGEQVVRWIAASERRAVEMIGPAPCFFNRRDGYYRWQIILRGQDPAGLLRGRPLGDWQVEIDPPSLL